MERFVRSPSDDTARMMLPRRRASLFVLLAIGLAGAWAPIVEAQQTTRQWVAPRTADGHPNLQGNWSNATLTPVVRPAGVGPVLNPEQVRALEGGRAEFIEADLVDSDPNRGAPPVGGQLTGEARWDAGAGAVGGYNQFYIDGGDHIAIYNGEARSSLIVDPPDGSRPAYTEEAGRRLRESREFLAQFAQYDNPENRPLAERCIMSFGSNAGPPMLPNYFYNNNYTIVQTADHVLIMAEMVHDARIIKIGDGPRLPPHVRPWMGDSWGHWEGDVLVVETTNIHPLQRFRGNSSENLKVIERFSRPDENTVLYEFTIDDPTTYTAPWGGEVPMMRFDDKLFEYACHEGNYSLASVLSGARYQERMEAEEANDAGRD